jgi:hypothetical protein
MEKKQPGSTTKGVGPGRPALRGAVGATLSSHGVGPLVRGPRRSAERTRSRLAGQERPCAKGQRTSLRLLSRVRATTFMHCAVPPPDVPAPAGPVAKTTASHGRFLLGGRMRFRQGRPRGHVALAEVILRRTIRDVRPSVTCAQSLTHGSKCNRGAAPCRVRSRTLCGPLAVELDRRARAATATAKARLLVCR